MDQGKTTRHTLYAVFLHHTLTTHPDEPETAEVAGLIFDALSPVSRRRMVPVTMDNLEAVVAELYTAASQGDAGSSAALRRVDGLIDQPGPCAALRALIRYARINAQIHGGGARPMGLTTIELGKPATEVN